MNRSAMSHIALPKNAPGIIGPMLAYPETEVHLNGLAQALLRGPSSLTPGERELIAAVVSKGNECTFCTKAHAATARELLPDRQALVDQAINNDGMPNSGKLTALLGIAEKVRKDGRLVRVEDIETAKQAGADDKAIHDTVLIAAAFCMFNRYVDGLATSAPTDEESYKQIGKMLATNGYDISPIRSQLSDGLKI